MNEYTTSLGKRIEFVPIGPLLDKLHASQPEVKPPTYTVKTALGATEEWPLVEQVPTDDAGWAALIEKQDSDENKLAVMEYRNALTASQAVYSKNLMRLILTRGLKVEIPDGDEWVDDHRFLGLTVPDDPRERRVHYIETEVLATIEDYRNLVHGVFEASEVSEDLIAQFEAAFQRPVEKRGRPKAKRTAVDA
jgi:hypothetical protein